MEEIISEIKEIYSRYEKRYAYSLRKASAEALHEFEILIGNRLPESYRLYLAVNDFHIEFYKDYRLFDLNGVKEKWLQMRHLVDSELMEIKMDAHIEGFMENWDSGKIERCWWSRGWIPIAGKSSGDLICIDQSPGVSGTTYQLLKYDDISGPSIEERWSSFDDYLLKHLEYLKKLEVMFD